MERTAVNSEHFTAIHEKVCGDVDRLCEIVKQLNDLQLVFSVTPFIHETQFLGDLLKYRITIYAHKE